MEAIVNDTNTTPHRAGFFTRLKSLLTRAAIFAAAFSRRIFP
jgi:hypothetical protein